MSQVLAYPNWDNIKLHYIIVVQSLSLWAPHSRLSKLQKTVIFSRYIATISFIPFLQTLSRVNHVNYRDILNLLIFQIKQKEREAHKRENSRISRLNAPACRGKNVKGKNGISQ